MHILKRGLIGTVCIIGMLSLCLLPSGASAGTPSLIGDWEASIEAVAYQDVTNPDDQPIFATITGTMTITHQQDRVFAGWITRQTVSKGNAFT